MNRKKILFTILIFFLIGYAAASSLCGEELRHSEYEVKAAFLYNVGKFVEWPKNGSENNAFLTLCVLGYDPFQEKLAALEGKTIKGKKIIVKRIAFVSEAKNCDILFISSSEKTRISQIVKELANQPILTVGDTDSFAEKGVMINFYIENDRIKFTINTKAAERSDVKIHSNLLRLAKIVSR